MMPKPDDTRAGSSDENTRSSLDGRAVLYEEYRGPGLRVPVVFDRVQPEKVRAACVHDRQGVAYICNRCGYLVVLQATQADKDGKGVPQSIRCPRPGCTGLLVPSYRKCLTCGKVLEYY
jgi:hypothetical protein